MAGQKAEELTDIAFIGDERVVGEPALVAKMIEPGLDLFGKAGRGVNQKSCVISHPPIVREDRQ